MAARHVGGGSLERYGNVSPRQMIVLNDRTRLIALPDRLIYLFIGLSV